MSSSQSRDELKAKLNLETSRIHWHELQTYFARGQVVRVSPDLDLLEVATELAADNKARFEQWMNDGRVGVPLILKLKISNVPDEYCDVNQKAPFVISERGFFYVCLKNKITVIHH